MKKKQVNLKHYLAPQCAIVQLKDETPLLAIRGIKRNVTRWKMIENDYIR